MKTDANKFSLVEFLRRMLAGALIGLGAMLPGISGGVMCVIFGVYQPLMEVIADPFHKIKKHFWLLLPVIIGLIIGFLGIAKLLGFVLDAYPAPSVCLFVGLILGMVPSLFKTAGKQGRTKGSWISLIISFVVVLGLLVSLKFFINVTIEPNFFWYLFCGFAVAFSIIAPGMSFSTLLMPLDLYEPFTNGVANLDFSMLIPTAIGAIVTVIALARVVKWLFDNKYSIMFHAITGIVIAATLVIIPFESFALGVIPCLINCVLLVLGAVAGFFLEKFNAKFDRD